MWSKIAIATILLINVSQGFSPVSTFLYLCFCIKSKFSPHQDMAGLLVFKLIDSVF